MRTIKVDLEKRSYSIIIGRGILKNSGVFLKRLALGKDAVIVTNSTLSRLYGKILRQSLQNSGYSVRIEIVPDSEKAKSFKCATGLIDRIAKYDKNKKVFIVAFGGGVVGDIAGFVASIYKRGIPYVQIPTTLLAQVDSSIGGKVAVDLPIAKNLVGSFYQPSVVLTDISILNSLPEKQMVSGMSEIIKYGVVKDARLFRFLESNYAKVLSRDPAAIEYIVGASAKIKAGVVEADEFDRKGIRAALNYGHTIGHAIEAAAGYSERYNHGQAVAVGMVVALDIAANLGLIKEADIERIKDIIRCCGLPTKASGIRFNDIYGAHFHDKKFVNSKNRFVLPIRIGSVKIVEGIPSSVVVKSIKKSLRQ